MQRIEKSFDDLCILEHINFLIQEYPKLIEAINEMLPSAYALQQVLIITYF